MSDNGDGLNRRELGQRIAGGALGLGAVIDRTDAIIP